MSVDDQALHISRLMLEQDQFTRWLNPDIVKLRPGYCLLRLKIREEFLNHVRSLHGGITFSIADSAFALAGNTRNRVAVAINASISFFKPSYAGDALTVEAQEVYLGNKTANYRVTVHNSKNELMAVFDGTIYRTGKSYLEESSA